MTTDASSSKSSTSFRGLIRFLAEGNKLLLIGMALGAAAIIAFGIFRTLTFSPFGSGGLVAGGLFFLTWLPWSHYEKSLRAE